MTARELYLEAARRGLTISRYDAIRIIVKPTELLNRDPSFRETLRAHKFELLEWMRESSLRHLAKQVIAGEFAGCDRLTAKLLAVELLEGSSHALCQRAAFYLCYRHVADDQQTGE